jgi:hypothetical protein
VHELDEGEESGIPATALSVIQNLAALQKDALIRVGKLWLKPAQVKNVLGRYTEHVICRNPGDEFPYTLRGSGAALRIGEEQFLCCCRHQFPDYVPDNVGLLYRPDNRLLTPSKLVFPTKTTANQDDAFVDLCALDFRADDYDIANFQGEFFPANAAEAWPNNTTGLLLIAGYPTHLQKVTYEELKHIHATQVFLPGHHQRPAATPWGEVVELETDLSFDPDGMSGGTVFHLGRDAAGYFIGFAGVVTHGSDLLRQLQFLRAEIVFIMLGEYCRDLAR